MGKLERVNDASTCERTEQMNDENSRETSEKIEDIRENERELADCPDQSAEDSGTAQDTEATSHNEDFYNSPIQQSTSNQLFGVIEGCEDWSTEDNTARSQDREMEGSGCKTVETVNETPQLEVGQEDSKNDYQKREDTLFHTENKTENNKEAQGESIDVQGRMDETEQVIEPEGIPNQTPDESQQDVNRIDSSYISEAELTIASNEPTED